MKKIKWSQYTISTKQENFCVLFNSITRGMYIIDTEIKNNIDRYMENYDGIDDDTKRIVSKLYQQEFIVDKYLDEKQKFLSYRHSYYNKMFGTVLYILPTLRCNFVCPYCIQSEYIDEESLEMQHETVNKLSQWISDFLESNRSTILESMQINKKANEIKLVFFGGEPTLYNEKNYYIIDQIKKNLPVWADLSFTIITNGYNITEETIIQYKQRGLTGLQITLDGPPNIHNSRRTTKEKIPTFDNILTTIKRSISLGVNVVIRINVDDSNVDSIENLIDILTEKGLDGLVHLNIAPVDKCEANSEMDGHTDSVMCKFYDIFKKALYNNFTISLWECFCGVYARSFFVVTPNGDIFKCPSLLQEEYKVGSVYEEKLNHQYESIVNNNIEENCLNCSYVGLCGGGCYNQNVMNGKLMCQRGTFVPLVNAYCRSMEEYVRRDL